jgi:hypothetical protein
MIGRYALTNTVASVLKKRKQLVVVFWPGKHANIGNDTVGHNLDLLICSSASERISELGLGRIVAVDGPRVPHDEGSCGNAELYGSNFVIVVQNIGFHHDEVSLERIAKITSTRILLKVAIELVLGSGAHNKTRGCLTSIEQVDKTLIAVQAGLSCPVLINICNLNKEHAIRG